MTGYNKHKLTGTAVRKLRQQLNLTQQQFADALSVHRITVVRWEADQVDIPYGEAGRIRQVAAELHSAALIQEDAKL